MALITEICAGCGEPAPPDGTYCPHCGQRAGPLRVSWRHRAYWKVFLIGFVLYLVAMKLLAASGNPNLVPTVIVLGAFLVPVTFVVFLYENETLSHLAPSTVALTFFFGGVIGAFAAQLLEQQLVQGVGIVSMLAVGFSEEIAKLLAISWLLPRKEYRGTVYGIIFGAAAGMGFAAFESMGYGFTYLLLSKGNLDVLGQVLLSRGLLSNNGGRRGQGCTLPRSRATERNHQTATERIIRKMTLVAMKAASRSTSGKRPANPFRSRPR